MYSSKALIYCGDQQDSLQYQACLQALDIKSFATDDASALAAKLKSPFLFLLWQVDPTMPADKALQAVSHFVHHANTKDMPLIMVLPTEYPITIRDRFFQLGVTNIMTYPCYLSELSALASTYLHQQQKVDDLLMLVSNLTKLATNNEYELLIRKKAEDSLYQDSITDSMTGCYNKQAFNEAFEKEVARFERYGSPVSIAYLDLDHFKRINDKYGHPAGDAVIIQFANMLKSFCRQTDIVGRIGGEEFALLFSATAADELHHRLQDLCDQVANSTCVIGQLEIDYTVSIGYCQSQTGKQNLQQWMASAADKALYSAKENGRNQIQRFNQ